MATLDKVQAQIAKLQQRAEAMIAKQSSGVIEKIRDLMEKHGLTTADIDAHVGGKKRGRKPGSKSVAKSTEAAAKYRDPKTGATWSGRGRAPAWIANAKDRNKFLAGESALQSATETKKPKAGNYPRGPQEAKYQDPKTGATWSGRGRAPAWLASAKNRTAFLINGAAEGASAASSDSGRDASPKKRVAKNAALPKKSAGLTTTSSAAKKASAKKAAVKKAAVKKAAVKKAAVKKAATRKATAKSVSVKNAAAKQPAARKVAAKKAPSRKADVKSTESGTTPAAPVPETVQPASA